MLLLYNLQLFAEEGGDSSLAMSTEGLSSEGSATELDTTTAGQESVEATKPTFEELIEGDYKDDYKKAVKSATRKAIDKRFKNQADLQGQLDSYAPLLDMLSSKYGVMPNDKGYDVEALTRKMQEDNSLYEQEAFERGIDVDTLKQIKNLERQNAILERQRQEAEKRQGFEKLVRDSEQVKQFYPDFDLESELMNEDFGRLVATGVDPKTAYEVVHHDELVTGTMQYAVQRTKESVAKDIQSGNRPIENGTSSNASSSVGAVNLNDLSLAELADIKRRAESGERITFA